MRERSFGEIASAFGSKAHLVDVNRAHAHDDSAQNSWHSSTFEGQICPLRGAFTSNRVEDKRKRKKNYADTFQSSLSQGYVHCLDTYADSARSMLRFTCLGATLRA